jgi:DnaJ-class molecular chaperone
VTNNAPQHAIEYAYKRLASKWHPKKNPEDRLASQRMFNDVTHAYSVLSNPARRDHYDQMNSHRYTKDEALSTFDRFFRHNGIEEEEKEFFDKHDPNRKQNYYELLGVRRDACF